MRTRPALLAFAAALLFSLASPNTTQACDGGCGMGYGWGMGQLYNSLENRVPYFAAHPPVYYSHPVPRTYGHTPFAYPPHFRTPEFSAPMAPLQISNPFVPASDSPAADASTDDETVSNQSTGPVMVMNPFVVDTAIASTGR